MLERLLGEKEFRDRKVYIYLLILGVTLSFGFQAWHTLFNNFAVEVAGLNGFNNGLIQSIREVPGFLALLVVYLLLVFKEHHLGSLSVVIFGLGICLTGFLPTLYGLLFTTLLMSTGFHYYEVVSQSLTLQYFDQRTSPLVLGRLASIRSISKIAAVLTILLLSGLLSYKNIFLIFGGLVVIVGIYSFFIDPEEQSLTQQKKGFVFKRKYWLFYVLTMLAGARRQVFVAFAAFLLVKNFEMSVKTISILFLINNIIGYFFNPWVGRLINRFGERVMLSIEYTTLFFIFLAYAYTQSPLVVGILYILDHLSFSFGMGIKTYFHKIGNPEDIAPTMAVSGTINHFAAVIIPVVGGGLWMINYKIPFVAGAGLSIVSLIFVQFIRNME